MKRLLAIAILGLASRAGAEVPIPFADIPNATVKYYDVTGTTAAEVRRSVDAAKPRDPNDGLAVDALTQWQFDLSWEAGKKGRCYATLDNIKFSATVRVPRLVDRNAPRELRARFDRYLKSLLDHEDGHVRYAWEHRGDVAKAINGGKCKAAARVAAKAIDAIAAHDLAYDQATDHGKTTTVPL